METDPFQCRPAQEPSQSDRVERLAWQQMVALHPGIEGMLATPVDSSERKMPGEGFANAYGCSPAGTAATNIVLPSSLGLASYSRSSGPRRRTGDSSAGLPTKLSIMRTSSRVAEALP